MCLSLTAQSSEEYDRVQIALGDKTPFHLQRLGLEIDHGHWDGWSYFSADLTKKQQSILAQAGYLFKVIIPQVSDHYADQIGSVSDRGSGCVEDRTARYDTPAQFELGSYAGYYLYEEMLAIVDSMPARYPDIVSARTEISDTLTHEGRPIWGFRVSDNSEVDETDEPEILFTSLHHAREPMSLTQMIFQLWHLLENYESDPRVTYLIDNTEMYFVPCLNPDGYIRNQVERPNGGGLWRKNNRDNGDGTSGVDLNRNYGFEWGFDDDGSSPNTSSNVYRGPAPFSEPETQAIRDFCNEHEFQIAFNNHSFGNLLIWPYGFSDTPTPDRPTFEAMGQAMTRINDFVAGTGTQTVGYTVNGDSDDWMYGEQDTKPKIFALTPESGPGNFGFWPPISAIEEIAEESLEMNLTATELLLDYLSVSVDAPRTTSGPSLHISYEALLAGLSPYSGEISLRALHPGATVVTAAKTLSLNHLDTDRDSFLVELSEDIEPDTELKFLFTRTSAYTTTDTVTVLFGNQEFAPVLVDSFINEDNWIAEGSSLWTLTEEDFVSSPSSMTDSPLEDYTGNTFSSITLMEDIALPETGSARASFWCKWEIEPEYDYVILEASTDGFNWTSLCGLYTNEGSDNQISGEPLYDGVQIDWVREEIDLCDYLGEDVSLRFTLVSDAFVEGDGFYLDDFRVEVESGINTSTGSIPDRDVQVSLFPNPARNRVFIDTEIDYDQVSLINSAGQQVASQGKPVDGWIDLSFPSGLYQLILLQGSEIVASRTLTVHTGQ